MLMTECQSTATLYSPGLIYSAGMQIGTTPIIGVV